VFSSSYQNSGTQLFDSLHDPCGSLYKIKSDGTGLTQLTNSPGCAKKPTWSPDGQYIAFVANRNRDKGYYPDVGWNIYLMKADGSDIRQLTFFNNERANGGPVALSWSPVPGLRIGKTYVITELGDNLILRQQPSLKGGQIRLLKAGSPVTVVSGPVVDADEFFWRQVSLEDGTTGWVKEVGSWFIDLENK
jgi:dipeptidyl aminopeptidase/acylaminoacyl peptidase